MIPPTHFNGPPACRAPHRRQPPHVLEGLSRMGIDRYVIVSDGFECKVVVRQQWESSYIRMQTECLGPRVRQRCKKPAVMNRRASKYSRA